MAVLAQKGQFDKTDADDPNNIRSHDEFGNVMDDTCCWDVGSVKHKFSTDAGGVGQGENLDVLLAFVHLIAFCSSSAVHVSALRIT